MDANLDLNQVGSLPDGTKASQSGGFGVTAADIKRGHLSVPVTPEPEFVADPNAIDVQDPQDGPRRGFLARPNGWQR